MGLTWTRHLKCPKCAGEFDYEFVPGGTFTSIRVGTSRYMRCPLCHKFSVFSLREPPPAGATTPAEATLAEERP